MKSTQKLSNVLFYWQVIWQVNRIFTRSNDLVRPSVESPLFKRWHANYTSVLSQIFSTKANEVGPRAFDVCTIRFIFMHFYVIFSFFCLLLSDNIVGYHDYRNHLVSYDLFLYLCHVIHRSHWPDMNVQWPVPPHYWHIRRHAGLSFMSYFYHTM